MIHSYNDSLSVIDFDDKKSVKYLSCYHSKSKCKYCFVVRETTCNRNNKGSRIIKFSINDTDMENLLKMAKLQFESYEQPIS